MRDWQNERWVKLYVRDEPEWLILPWQARGIFYELLRKVDINGVLKLGRAGRKAIATILSTTWDENLNTLVEALLEDGAIAFLEDETILYLPNFLEAQEARQSDVARQRKKRERSKALKTALFTPPRLNGFGIETNSNLTPLVYFIAIGDKIRIGKTKNIATKVREVQINNTETVELLGTESVVPRDPGKHSSREKELYILFAKHRILGDLFNADKEILKYVSENTKLVEPVVENNSQNRSLVTKRDAGVTPRDEVVTKRDKEIKLDDTTSSENQNSSPVALIGSTSLRSNAKKKTTSKSSVTPRDATVTKRDEGVTPRDEVVTKRDKKNKRDDATSNSSPVALIGSTSAATGKLPVTPRDAGVTKRDATVTPRDAGVTPRDAKLTGGVNWFNQLRSGSTNFEITPNNVELIDSTSDSSEETQNTGRCRSVKKCPVKSDENNVLLSRLTKCHEEREERDQILNPPTPLCIKSAVWAFFKKMHSCVEPDPEFKLEGIPSWITKDGSRVKTVAAKKTLLEELQRSEVELSQKQQAEILIETGKVLMVLIRCRKLKVDFGAVEPAMFEIVRGVVKEIGISSTITEV